MRGCVSCTSVEPESVPRIQTPNPPLAGAPRSVAAAVASSARMTLEVMLMPPLRLSAAVVELGGQQVLLQSLPALLCSLPEAEPRRATRSAPTHGEVPAAAAAAAAAIVVAAVVVALVVVIVAAVAASSAPVATASLSTAVAPRGKRSNSAASVASHSRSSDRELPLPPLLLLLPKEEEEEEEEEKDNDDDDDVVKRPARVAGTRRSVEGEDSEELPAEQRGW